LWCSFTGAMLRAMKTKNITGVVRVVVTVLLVAVISMPGLAQKGGQNYRLSSQPGNELKKILSGTPSLKRMKNLYVRVNEINIDTFVRTKASEMEDWVLDSSTSKTGYMEPQAKVVTTGKEDCPSREYVTNNSRLPDAATVGKPEHRTR
jgi:hypothetical protein